MSLVKETCVNPLAPQQDYGCVMQFSSFLFLDVAAAGFLQVWQKMQIRRCSSEERCRLIQWATSFSPPPPPLYLGILPQPKDMLFGYVSNYYLWCCFVRLFGTELRNRTAKRFPLVVVVHPHSQPPLFPFPFPFPHPNTIIRHRDRPTERPDTDSVNCLLFISDELLQLITTNYN